MVYSYKGLDVFYKVRGSGDPVIFLHGWGCESSIFDAPAEAVAAQYKAVSIDFPGFGQSSEPDTVWGVEEYTSMLESFVRDNGFDNPVLIGHSFGGRVSILYSSRNPVSKVVLTDAAGVKPKRLEEAKNAIRRLGLKTEKVVEILHQGILLQVHEEDDRACARKGKGCSQNRSGKTEIGISRLQECKSAHESCALQGRQRGSVQIYAFNKGSCTSFLGRERYGDSAF